MRMIAAIFAAALLYGAGAITANLAFAAGLSEASVAALKDMRSGQMGKLVFHSAPRDAIDTPFLTADGSETGFAAWRGKVLVVNFWATWCPPCRKEMPSLDRLRAAVAGPDIDVISINVERRGLKKAAKFFDEVGLQSLAIHSDEEGLLPRAVGVLGYPVTIILDREGREVARMQGDAEWDAPEAKAILARIVADTAKEGVVKTEADAPLTDG
jgi:thiol-disulfide isomerase/thioredoxin